MPPATFLSSIKTGVIVVLPHTVKLPLRSRCRMSCIHDVSVGCRDSSTGRNLPNYRRWTCLVSALLAAPLLLGVRAEAKVVETVSYSRVESAGLKGQSNKDVAKFADFGDGLKVEFLDKPKYGKEDTDALRQVQSGDTVTVDLIGYLAGWNGVVFVRTQDKSGFSENPVTFRVGGGEAIPGLDRGVVGMVKGEKRRLVVPSNLGYPRPLRDEDLGKPGAIPNPLASSSGSGAPWELRNRLLNGVINNSSRDDTLVLDVKLTRLVR